MILAEAEAGKAQAEMINAQTNQMQEQREMFEAQQKAVNDAQSNEIKAFDSETKRQKVMVDAVVAGADVEKKTAETSSVELDNAQKTVDLINSELEARIKDMAIEDLMRFRGQFM